MPSSYESFQSRGPNIDVNLFLNAMTTGINAGNQQKTKLQAVFEGVSGAIKGGISTAKGIQEVRANQIELERESDPAVQQARKDKIIADADLAEKKAKEAESVLEAEAKRKRAELAIADADQKIGDIRVKDELDVALKNPATPAEVLTGLFNKASGAFSRDNDFAVQSLERAKGRMDPTQLESFRQAYDAVQIEKTRAELAQSKDRALQTQAIKKKEDIDNATATLNAISPRVREIMGDTERYDPTKLDVIPAGSAQTDKSDPKNPTVKFDAEGRPLIAAKSNPDDKRYYVTYNGEVVDTLDEVRGKDAAKAMQDYRLGTSAIMKDRATLTPEPAAAPAAPSFQNQGLAADQQRLNRQLEGFTGPASPKAVPTVPPEVLEGKSPEQQAAIQERFDQRIATLQNVPREARAIVQRVNNHPLLKTAAPYVKGLISVESGGRDDAKSPTGVVGLGQVTGDTYAYLKKKYPTTFSKLVENTPEAELTATKMYIVDLYNIFGDRDLVSAAYNAGPGALSKAIMATKGQKTWANVKPNLKSFVSEEKFKEVENYPEKVAKFTSYYNG